MRVICNCDHGVIDRHGFWFADRLGLPFEVLLELGVISVSRELILSGLGLEKIRLAFETRAIDSAAAAACKYMQREVWEAHHGIQSPSKSLASNV
jgi:hypothetical protein